MTVSTAGHRVDIVSRTLARNRLGVPAVVFFVLAAAAPMTVVAGGATTGWAVTEVIGIPVGYLAIAGTLVLFSFGYTAMSRKIVNSGAFYSYIAQGLGRVFGVGSAFVAVLGYNVMQIGLYGGFGFVTAGLVSDLLHFEAAWWIYALLGWAIIGVLGVMRVDINGKVLAALLIGEIGITLVYDAVMIAHPAAAGITADTLLPIRLFDGGIGAGLATAFAGFVGFEATAVYAEETKDPRRTVPRATYIALSVIGLLYAGSSWAISVAAGSDLVVALAKQHSTELMFVLVKPYLGLVWIHIGHILFVTSLFAALLSFHNTVARYLFALGRERVLPAILGTTGRHNSAPKWASLTQTTLAFAVIVGYAIAGLDPIVYMFFWLTVLGGLGVLILMTATSVAVVVFFARPENRDAAGPWSRIIAPVLATALLCLVLYLTLDSFAVLLGLPDPTSAWRWVLPSSFAAVALLGMLWALVMKVRSPDTYNKIGLGASTRTAMG